MNDKEIVEAFVFDVINPKVFTVHQSNQTCVEFLKDDYDLLIRLLRYSSAFVEEVFVCPDHADRKFAFDKSCNICSALKKYKNTVKEIERDYLS